MSDERPPLIHIYTGCGKGKSTSAAGLALRAASHEKKVLVIYFNKPKSDKGEHTLLNKCRIDTLFFASEHPFSPGGGPFEDMRRETLEGVNRCRAALIDDDCFMVVLDELIISLRDGLLTKDELLSLVNIRKPDTSYIIMTGRDAPEWLIERADLVSSIDNIKHPYDKGEECAIGIEY